MNYKNIIINSHGYLGEFGGDYTPHPLKPVMKELSNAFEKLKNDPAFIKELRDLHTNYIGRPSPLVYAKNLSKELGGAQIFLKNEGLNHTGAHKINHVSGQILIAKYLGKKRIIAETGAGQHGLATASMCAKMNIPCTIYMGELDYLRQRPNVYYMELCGAEVIAIKEGQRGLRDAVNAGIKDLLCNSQDSYYLLGTACGPHPYPSMNVFFQKIIGEEVRTQLKVLPDYMIACVGGGSNSLGLFYDFLDDTKVKLIGVEGGGKGTHTKHHAARFSEKKVGVLEGFKSYFLQNNTGQIQNTYSISAGLDYAGVSPQIAFLEQQKRVKMTSVTDTQALHAMQTLMKYEGILPALESSHGLAYAIKIAPNISKNKRIVVGISGRGDKDLFITAPIIDKKFIPYLSNFIKNET